MKKKTLFAASIVVLMSVQGCATKTYGRQGILTGYEKETMTCRELDLEIAKVGGFIEHVNKESEFSGRDVLAILGDGGIGNGMEKVSALESANSRINQLQEQRFAKKCMSAPSA